MTRTRNGNTLGGQKNKAKFNLHRSRLFRILDLNPHVAIFKTRNGESVNGNGERGTGNGERGTGNGESLNAGIFKTGNL